MSLETKFCTNCQKNVAENNYFLHSLHCERHSALCDECLESFPETELAQHKKEQHSIVSCELCDQKTQQWKLQDHKLNTCIQRPLPCQYCEIDVPWSDIKEHEDYCGGRTEVCKDCKKYVRMKDLRKHPMQCLKESSNETVFCHVCNIKLKQSAYEGHLKLCSGHSRLKNILKAADRTTNRNLLMTSLMGEKKPDGENMDSANDVVINKITSSFSKIMSLENTTEDDATDSCTEIENDTSFNKSVGRSVCSNCQITYFAPVTQANELCKSCRGKVFPESKINDNQQIWDNENSFVSPLPTFTQIKNVWENCSSEESEAVRVPGMGTQGKTNVSESTVIYVDCPLCTKSYPSATVHEHIDLCKEIKTPCPICCADVKLGEKQNHVSQCVSQRQQLSNVIPALDNVRARKRTIMDCLQGPNTQKNHAVRKNEDNLLPCEFCETLFPDFLLIEHQSACRPDLLHFSGEQISLKLPDMLSNPTHDAEFQNGSWKSNMVHSIRGSKRGRQQHNHYYEGRFNALPSEFVPNMQYAGYPDCYKLYDSTMEKPFHFGSNSSSTKKSSIKESVSFNKSSYSSAIKSSPSATTKHANKDTHDTDDSDDDLYITCSSEFHTEPEKEPEEVTVKAKDYSWKQADTTPIHKHLSKKKKKKGKGKKR